MEPSKGPNSDARKNLGPEELSEETKRQIKDLRAVVGNRDGEDDADDEGGEDGEIPQRRRIRFRRQERERELRTEQENVNPYWYKDPNIAIKVPKPDAEWEVLDSALQASREQLETLKRSYCRSKSRRYQEISDAYFHEIKRLVNAIEGLKDVLASRGEEYRVYFTDREHPDIACRRIILDCFIATEVYGCAACETDRLRHFRDTRLVHSRPGRWFVRYYYRVLGPRTAALLRRYPRLAPVVRMGLDQVVRRLPDAPSPSL